MAELSDLVPPHIEAMVPYLPGKPLEELERELGIPAGSAVKLASNENPRGPSARAVAAIRDAARHVNRYPDGGAWALREALAAHHGVSMDELVVAAGSNELINLLALTFVHPDEEVLVSECSFICYELACRAVGVPFRAIPMREHIVDLAAMAQALSARTKLVFLGNPNNPTGTYFTRSAFEAFLAQLPAQTMVVMDEAYFEYATATDYPNSLDYRARTPRLVTLRTFSKIHGLAGVRVGYCVASRDIVSCLNRTRAPFNVSSLGQAAALAALGDREHVQKSREMNRCERTRLVQELGRLGCDVTPSEANFLLVMTPAPAPTVYEHLLQKGVIVRPVASYGLLQHLRITVGTDADNTRLLTALAEILR